jgi:methionine aminopeptidase
MPPRTVPASDPRMVEIARQTKELAVELAGPGASVEEIELFVDSIRREVVARALREERAARTATDPPRPARAKSRRR